MTTSKTIIARFKAFFKEYVGAVPRLSAAAKTAQQTAKQTVRANGAIAGKTMTTRKILYGEKGTTGAGVQSIRQSGKDRTKSTKK